MAWWEAKAAKIGERDWGRIEQEWLNYIPVSLDTPPSESLSELVTLQPLLNGLAVGALQKVDSVSHLRENILVEGVYLLKKAANVLIGTQVHVTKGLCSWSISSAYHSAFFSMKAVQSLLGLSVVEVGRSCIVDVWPPTEPQSSSSRRRGEQPIQKIMLLKLDQSRIEHRPLWAFFQRLIRVLNIDDVIWPSELLRVVSKVDVDAFAYQRNGLHYRNCHWPFPEDLCRFVTRESFGLCGKIAAEDWFDDNRQDFTFVLSLTLFWMGFRLLSRLGEFSEPVKSEADKMRQWMASEINCFYRSPLELI